MEALQPSSTTRFQDLKVEDKQHIRTYLISVQNKVELDDIDSKNMLCELSQRMSAAPVANEYPLLRQLLEAVAGYLQDREREASIERIHQIITTIRRESN